ncbi:MAG: hypothetical protein IJS88_03105 [Alphaproteobacteria bacterium]|nr:hypothetical protein [Alphaproteobacteria bacterium]
MARRNIGGYSDLHLSGFLAWMHRVIMFITFPIRKFWQIAAVIVAVLALLVIAHFYYGIGFDHISYWYNKLVPIKEISQKTDDAAAEIYERLEQIKSNVSEMVNAENTDSEQQEDEVCIKKRFVAWNVPEFKKIKYKPLSKSLKFGNGFRSKWQKQNEAVSTKEEPHIDTQAVSMKEETAVKVPELHKGSAVKPLIERPRILKKIRAPQKEDFYSGKITDYYEITENRGLIYLETPEVLFGPAKILGPNSLYVGDVFMFLYGIYTDATDFDVRSAKKYLEQITEKKNLRCEIVAYTAQTEAATALCFIKGAFVNREMVQHGFANNVALK